MDPLMGAALIGGGSSLLGGLTSAIGGSSSAKKVARAIKYAANLQDKRLREGAADAERRYNVYADPGRGLMGKYAYLMSGGLGGEAFDYNNALASNPAYQWQQQQAEKMLNRQAAAGGRWNSRASMNALLDNQRALGAQEYGALTNRLGSLVDRAQMADQNTVNAMLGANQMGAQIQANAANQAAQLQGNASANMYNTIGSSLSNLGQIPMQMYGMNMFQNALNPTSSYTGGTYSPSAGSISSRFSLGY